MRSPARRLALGITALLAACPDVRAAERIFPAVEGELTGKLELFAAEGAPVLQWKLTARSAPKEREIDFAAEGSGTRVQGDLRLDPAGNGTWRLAEAQADLAVWSRALAARLGPMMTDLATRGRARLAGEGTWQNELLDGRAYLSVLDGRVEMPGRELVLEGLELEFVLEDISERRSAPAQRISWTHGRYATLELGAGRIMFTLAGDQVQVDEGVIDMLGGRVSLAAFSFSLRKPEPSFITRAVGIDVALLVPLIPFLAEASGKLDGTLMLRYSEAGIAVGAGELSLRSGEPAQLRLLPSPGLITEHVPAQVLARVPNLKKIETGEAPIKAHTFDVSFTPEGDQEGRSAVLHLVGEPIDPTFRAPIDLTVNYRGPIEWLVRFGSDSRLQLGGNR